jgi:hypothetical protein
MSVRQEKENFERRTVYDAAFEPSACGNLSALRCIISGKETVT